MSDPHHAPTSAPAMATASAASLPVTAHRRARVAVIRVDHPPVNALSQSVRAGLLAAFEAAIADDAVHAMVIACGGRTFIAGADIREFGRPMQPPLAGDVIERIAQSTKPVIAAMHGTALGGGFELAMACQFRVAARGTRIGLPEVRLGILPGSGGTQRLPRLIGVDAALRMIVSGAPVDADEALDLGAIDAVVDGDLVDGAVRFAERVVRTSTPARLQGDAPVVCHDPEVFARTEAEIRRKHPGVEAPLACVRAVKFACELPLADGLREEYALCMTLMHSPQSRALRHVFAAERQVMKLDGLPDDTATWPVRRISRVGVVGAGRMGGEIVAAIIDAGLTVVVSGRDEDGTARAVARVHALWQQRIEQGTLASTDTQTLATRLVAAHDERALCDCDLVIESVAEAFDHKQAVFRRLDALCSPGVVLAGHTAGLSIDQLADATRRPANVVGLHFFQPLKTTRLVEIVRTSRTDTSVVATLMQFAKRLGKVPMVSGTGNGFIVNRMLAARSREVHCLLDEGAAPRQVDRVLTALGFSPVPSTQANPVNPGMTAKARRDIADDEIRERCLLALVNEGARLLDEGIASRPLDLDIAAVHGLGFPAHVGGPMFYADERGLPDIVRALNALADVTNDKRWRPAATLVRLAHEGRRFYDDA